MLIQSLFIFLMSFQSSADVDPLCQEGDLIFLDMDSVIFEQVAVATQTWTSHVGIAVFDEGWQVVESALLVSRKSSLCKYLARTEDGRFAVRRLNSYISPHKMIELKDYLSEQMGVPYDTGFDYDEADSLFCSKLVYNAFADVLNVEVGEIKTLQMIFDENPNGSLTFWKWWFLGSIPWDRRTVTPKDQLIDDDFWTVLQSD
jgi:hypothetical protein